MRRRTDNRGCNDRVLTALLASLLMLPAAASAAPRDASTDEAAATPKPVPPIAISHSFRTVPAVGQPLDLTLSIRARGDVAAVNVSLDADDPLAMIDPIDSIGLGPLAAGEVSDVAITVLPLIDRTHYLSVTVTATIDGIAQTRSVAVPIRLAGSAARKAEDGPAPGGEESVHSFEAIETVR